MIYEQGERFLNQVPPFLAYNVISALHDPLSMGLNVVMLPTYEPDKFADNLYKLKINHAIAGPADLRSFDNEQLLEKLDFFELKNNCMR